MEILYAHFFWLAVAASALNSAILAVVAGISLKTDHGSLLLLIFILTTLSHFISFIYFLCGKIIKLFWHKYLQKHPEKLKPNNMQRIHKYIEKYRSYFVLMYRFIPGFRMASPYIIGMNVKGFWRFFFVDWLAAFIWAVVFAVLGYLCGEAIVHFMDDLSKYDQYIYVLIVIFVVIFSIRRVIKRRRRK
ncbi:MAG: DedA family protein [Francisellaceae bacterium]